MSFSPEISKCGKGSIGFLRAYVVTMRPYLMVLSGVTGMAGMSLTSEAGLLKIWLIFLASFLSYGFGQALTDCFQIDTDRISAPYRPLTQGAVNRVHVLGVSLAGLAFCVLVFAAVNPLNLILGVIAGLGLATYTPFKRRWWGGPWYNAWIVCVLCVMGYVGGTERFETPLPSSLPWVLAAVFFGYANFVLVGYYKDIGADAQTGYQTLPVVVGREISARVSESLAAVGAFALLVARLNISNGTESPFAHPVSWGLIAAALGTSLYSQILLHRVTRDAEAHRPIGLVVHSYILGLSGVAIAARPDWTGPLLVLYLAFLILMGIRPSRSQI
jgi:4-hydroxybenzoate polyprenyltransferase